MFRIVTAIALAVFLSGTPVRAAQVTVFAAASLKEALGQQIGRFESDTGNRVTAVYAGSNALAKQIEAGAPADVFISADLDWMDYLGQRKLLASGSRTNLLRNTLVLVAPASTTGYLKITPGFNLSRALAGGKLAMANTESVPAGKYGKAALETLGVWDAVKKQVVQAENVRTALAFVARGEAAFGIVYRTDALAEKGVRIVDEFPQSSHPPIVYPAAIVAGHDTPASEGLLDALRSEAARSIWEKHGFEPF